MEILRALARLDTVFGSDVYVSYSHEYAWQANQFGHVLIGLAATFAFGWLLSDYLLAFAAVAILYFLKELIDALIAIRLAPGVFPVDRREILLDGLVDFGFVLAGGALAWAADPASMLADLTTAAPAEAGARRELADWLFILFLVLLLAFFMTVRRPCLAAKRAFDKSNLPQLVRLSTFPQNFADDDWPALAAEIAAFASGSGSGTADQLVISGPPDSGRSTLAKAIGGDASACLRKVRYITASRLVEKRRIGFEHPSAPKQPWQLGEAGLVIVDDLPVAFLEAASPAKAVSRLIDVADGETIFEQPLRSDGEAGAAPAALRPLPGIVWVVDDAAAARRLLDGLQARFPGRRIVAVALQQALAQSRARAAERSSPGTS
ncbi:ATP-binding protein [Marinibaculum pumilum]|uniref:ATP-binding protein n=1 Tax=Marinibaculum pumilum TaxID=1766165 RepID=A0ABV7L964_9PROT